MAKQVLVIFGPVANLRETGKDSTYGEDYFEDVQTALRKRAETLDIGIDYFPFGAEGDILDALRKAEGNYSGVIIDTGALAYAEDALRNAVESMHLPCVEVKVAEARPGEELRHESPISSACVGVIAGFGKKSYFLALEALTGLIYG